MPSDTFLTNVVDEAWLGTNLLSYVKSAKQLLGEAKDLCFRQSQNANALRTGVEEPYYYYSYADMSPAEGRPMRESYVCYVPGKPYEDEKPSLLSSRVLPAEGRT